MFETKNKTPKASAAATPKVVQPKSSTPAAKPSNQPFVLSKPNKAYQSTLKPKPKATNQPTTPRPSGKPSGFFPKQSANSAAPKPASPESAVAALKKMPLPPLPKQPLPKVTQPSPAGQSGFWRTGAAPTSALPKAPLPVSSNGITIIFKQIKGELYVRKPNESNAVKPSDVHQGNMGDCYFLASVAALAKTNPEMIKQMIQQNKDGSFTVRFTSQQVAPNKVFQSYNDLPIKDRFVTVQNNFAYEQGAGNTLGAKPSPDLWPLVLEKAFSKDVGSYATAGGGGFAAKVLTNYLGVANTETALLAQQDRGQLKQALGQSGTRPTVASTVTMESKVAAKAAAYNIYPSHAYAVLGTSMGEAKGKPVMMVNLYNPWGQKVDVPLDVFIKYFDRFDQALTEPKSRK